MRELSYSRFIEGLEETDAYLLEMNERMKLRINHAGEGEMSKYTPRHVSR